MRGYTIEKSIDLLEKDVKELWQTGAGGTSADHVTFNNSGSGLAANNVQEALRELDHNVEINVEDIEDLETDVSYLDTDVTKLKESLNKLYDDGFASYNIYDGNVFEQAFIQSNGTPIQNDKFYNAVVKVEATKEYTISFNQYSSVRGGIFGFANYPTLNAQGTVIVPFDTSSWTEKTITVPSGINYIAFVVWKNDTETSYTLAQKVADVQVEKGSTKHSYTPFAYGNTDLTKELNFAIDNDYIGTNLLDNEYTLGINHVGTSANNRSLSKAITVSSGQKIYVKCCNNPNSLQYLVGEYTSTESSSYISALGSWTSANTEFEYTIPSNVNSVRIVLKRANESAMVASDLDGLKISITSEPYVPSNADLKESLANQGTWSTSSASEIGMYGDKKLYRKIFTKSATGDGANVVASSISTGIGSSAKIKHIYGIARRASDGLMYIIPYVQLAVSQFVSVFVDSSGWIQIRMKTSDTLEYNFEITVEYTE